MMKRLRSYGEDSASGEKDLDWTASFSSSSQHRRFCRSRPPPSLVEDRDREGSARGGLDLKKRGGNGFGDNTTTNNNNFDDREVGVSGKMNRKRFEADLEGFDDREGGSRGLRKRGDRDLLYSFDDRGLRKRMEHEVEGGFERRKGFDRYQDRDIGVASSTLTLPRGVYVGGRERERNRDSERIHRSESFCTSRRYFPKGFRSERHCSRRDDNSSSSWTRFDFRNKTDVEDAESSPVERGGSSGSNNKGDVGGVTSSTGLSSPQGIKDGKSPSWSKGSRDLDGEASKDTKKNESMVVESAVSKMESQQEEIEEGELQPDSPQLPAHDQLNDSVHNFENAREYGNEVHVDVDAANKSYEFKPCQIPDSDKGTSIDENVVRECEKEATEKVDEDGKQKMVVNDAYNDVVEGTENSTQSQSDFVKSASASKEIVTPTPTPTDIEDVVVKTECSPPTNFRLQSPSKVEEPNPMSIHRSSPEKETVKSNFDHEVGLELSNKYVQEEIQKEPEPCVNVMKDKGKSVAMDEVLPRENCLLIEQNFIDCRYDAMEGPSTRGFELFSSTTRIIANQSAITKTETGKMKLEPLDLSLSLPSVSVAAASNTAALAAPSSPSRARSVQSFGTTFRTGSDCFTTSISFSGSQFLHNPSCSLTHNSVDCDFEKSVKSRPLFQGVDWQALSANDSIPKEVLNNQKLAENDKNSLHLSQGSHAILNGRALQARQQGTSSLLNRSASFQGQLSGKVRQQDVPRSPAQSTGSHDTRSEFGKDKIRAMGEESVSRLFRSSSQKEIEQGVAGEKDRVEQIIYLIVSVPIQAMAWRVQELPERSVICLKDSTREIIIKQDNRQKLFALQEILRKRSDLNLETLLKSHRAQLQILVAIKSGLSEFVQRADGVTSSDLAEIFLNLKCRNIICRNALPVYECDCRFCSSKNGHCSSCMCLVCSKFDAASNTCGWVGCDVCDHWCHTNCGLLKSYIRNGRSASGVSEMQFYCLACEHPSEMFGFVKDVFKNCASEWKAETLCRELEYVKKIFSASNDTRGKLLHEIANQLLPRLQSRANAVEICNQIMGFLNECDSKFSNGVGSSSREVKEVQPPHRKNIRDTGNGVSSFIQEPIWSKPISTTEIPETKNAAITLPTTDGNSSAAGSLWKTTEKVANKPAVVDELDSIIKIKMVEAQMFQKRADDARRESEGLKHIVIAKSEEIEKEYANRIENLGLSEVEKRRSQKLQELQILERSHCEYFNMKERMHTDIKDLHLKMEAARTRRNGTSQ